MTYHLNVVSKVIIWHNSFLRRMPRFMHTASLNQKENSFNYLRKHLNINENEASYMLMKYPAITKLNEKKLKSLLDTINELGYPNEVLVKEPSLFGILPITLRFRYKVLEECGVENVSSSLLLSYLPIVKQKTIGQLKKSGVIHAHMNIENRLAGYMTQWPTSLTTLIYEDVNELTLYNLRLKIIQRYLELLLDLTKEEFYRGVKTYPTIKHRPLKAINETLQILQSEVMMVNQKLKSNLYLIHVDPENLKLILHKLRSIGGIDVREILRMHPKIATKKYSTIIEIRSILQEYGISNEAQMRCFDIYTLGPNTIRERLERAKQIPEFNAFFNHPRFLKMIYYNTTAIKRLNKLYSYNKKCLSLNVLSGSSAHYETFEKAPGDRLGKGKDLIFCILQSLGKEYSASGIRNVLKRHPFWINIPLIQVKFVFDKLSMEFSRNDIYENCPILLYPWNKIKETLDLFKNKELHKFPFFHDNLNFDNLSKSHILSLALYILEKNHYFTGNGVWTEENRKIVIESPHTIGLKNIAII